MLLESEGGLCVFCAAFQIEEQAMVIKKVFPEVVGGLSTVRVMIKEH